MSNTDKNILNIDKNKYKLEKYSYDASIFRMTPSGILTPKNLEEIEEIVQYINKNNLEASKNSGIKKLTLTARAAGTCMSGGPLTENLIVSFTEHMQGRGEIEFHSNKENKKNIKYYIDIEPGLYHRDLEKYINKHGLMFPPYPASKDLCAMGGIINNNSGGEKTLKYGKTEKYLREIDMVCADGNNYKFYKQQGDDLDHLLNINNEDYYARIHRDVYNLLKSNWHIVERNKPKVSKNSAGYYLWNTYNPTERWLDLSALFCGAQGTLGLMTKAKIELVPITTHSRMITFYLENIKGIADIVNELRKYNPESLELYDDHTFKIAMKYLPNMISKMQGNIFKLAISFWPEIKMILTGGIPKIVIMAEFTDTNTNRNSTDINKKTNNINQETLENNIEKYYLNIQNFIKNNDLKINMTLAKSQKEADKYWLFRRESFNLLRSKLKGVRTAPFIEDVVVPAESFPSFMPRFEKILDKHKLLYTIAGHAGDGNLHVIPLMKLKDSNSVERLKIISDEVYQLVSEYGGSITGEHNDGMVHAPFLHYMYDEEMLELFQNIKNIFDPNNIFNPGKKVGVKWGNVARFIDRRI